MADPKPRNLSFREVEFWKHRFDPERLLTIEEIQTSFELDRSYFHSAQAKLRWNLKHGLITPQTQELLDLAKKTTQVEEKMDENLPGILARARSHQVNWERQRERYRRKVEKS